MSDLLILGEYETIRLAAPPPIRPGELNSRILERGYFVRATSKETLIPIRHGRNYINVLRECIGTDTKVELFEGRQRVLDLDDRTITVYSSIVHSDEFVEHMNSLADSLKKEHSE